MIKKQIYFLRYAFLIYIIVFEVSCREPFDYSLPGSDQKVLVVDGLVTNDFGPYMITLSQAVPYGKNNQLPVKKAHVYVVDDSNKSYIFTEKSFGQYISDSASFKGEIGRTYTLYIQTADGLEYRSNPCKIEPESKIDSVYGFNEQFLLYPAGTQDNSDDIYADGLHIYTDISYSANQKMNTMLDAIIATPYTMTEWHFIYKIHYNITFNKDSTVIIRTPDGYVKTDSFEIITTSYNTQILNSLPIIKTNSDYSSGSKINKIPIGYFNGTPYSETINDSTFYSEGGNWVLLMKAYTISNETFNYFYNLTHQIDGSNNFFEPIPVQLKGNITCTSDSSILVFGLFQANSIVKKYIGIVNNGLNYKCVTAYQMPPISRDSIGGTPNFK